MSCAFSWTQTKLKHTIVLALGHINCGLNVNAIGYLKTCAINIFFKE
jgi:hypothetical protein